MIKNKIAFILKWQKKKKLSKSNERNYQTEIERLKSLKEELINNNVDINLNKKPKTRIR